MSTNLELPEEVIEALGPEPERATLEAVLLFLVSEDRMSVARAGRSWTSIGCRRSAGTPRTASTTRTFRRRTSPKTSATHGSRKSRTPRYNGTDIPQTRP